MNKEKFKQVVKGLDKFFNDFFMVLGLSVCLLLMFWFMGLSVYSVVIYRYDVALISFTFFLYWVLVIRTATKELEKEKEKNDFIENMKQWNKHLKK